MAENPKKDVTKIAAIMAMILIAAAIGSYLVWHSGRVMSVASAYFAKTLCSGVFVAGRSADDIIAEDVMADMTVFLKHWDADVDRERRVVRSSIFGFVERGAIYRPGLGCTLVTGTTVDALADQAGDYTPPALVGRSAGLLWPEGSRVDTEVMSGGVDAVKLKRAVDSAFAEPYPKRLPRRTRTVVIVHNGRIISEKYADGFKPDTPQIGWSMGKSVMNALIGTLIADRRLETETKGLFPEWSANGDPRATISVDDLLRMVSGLDFDEPHTRMLSDVRTMLFLKGDSAAYVKSEDPAMPVGKSWFYASGSTTLLASAMRDAIGGSQADYFTYPYRALFAPIGMTSAIIEPDAAGTFLAPAFAYASARDWARLGLLYLNDGVWQGKRILPEGWVRSSLAPTPHSQGQYGAHLWLTVPAFLRPASASQHNIPEDAFFMLGHDGQMIAIVPSRDLVVVRLGLSRRRNAWDHNAFLSGILEAIPER
ncbi:MAG: beta-lactamase family protein [Hyphomicrobiaceae bacterium]|nr:beta-lactamase family protein [Hyphomicrobiaceae bacterium]